MNDIKPNFFSSDVFFLVCIFGGCLEGKLKVFLMIQNLNLNSNKMTFFGTTTDSIVRSLRCSWSYFLCWTKNGGIIIYKERTDSE